MSHDSEKAAAGVDGKAGNRFKVVRTPAARKGARGPKKNPAPEDRAGWRR
jgi:hypothetical protein